MHNFSVRLDGFGTDEGQSLESPSGHAYGRLLDWLFATRAFHAMPGRLIPHPAGVPPQYRVLIPEHEQLSILR